jgi:hypothetical protein
MSHENFWLSVKAMAELLDGSRKRSEQTLHELEGDIERLDPVMRNVFSGEISFIVTQLSGLKLKLDE